MLSSIEKALLSAYAHSLSREDAEDVAAAREELRILKAKAALADEVAADLKDTQIKGVYPTKNPLQWDDWKTRHEAIK